MRLRRLVAERFRNLEPFDLSLPAQFVVLEGPNAQGKTNALEAIHVVATLKPLRGRRIGQLIRWGEQDAAVAAWVERDSVERHFRLDLTRTGRTARLDGKKVVDLKAYFEGVRAISFTPADGRVVSGEPSRRRGWLDRAVFTATPAHLDRVRAYRATLQQKGAALRLDRVDMALLDVLDQQLCELGAQLVTHRVAMLESLVPHVQELHGSIAGGHGTVGMSYRTYAEGDTVEERRTALAARLAEVRPRELDRRSTLAGPQLDDVKIALDRRSAREYASRGQVRSIVLALKVAEMVAAQQRGDIPLFLIDDASTELDGPRTGRLVALLSDLGAQVIATTTDASPLTAALPREDTQLVHVQDGVLTPR